MTFLAVSAFGLGALGLAQQPLSTAVVGRQRGTPFSDMEIPSRGRVSEVYVFSEDYICAVQVQFAFSDNRAWMSPRRGGRGCQLNSFHLDLDEYIVGISGRYDAHVNSLQIHTNKRMSPLFGGSGGTQEYRIDLPAGNQAVGFVGRSGHYLNAIGLNFVPLTISQAGQTIIVGGDGGSAFSDSDIPLGARISEVRVRSEDTIIAIQAVYTLWDGRLLEGPVHGGEGGSLSVLRLDADEYIIGFSGRSGAHIDSLSIRTNKRTSQVFGGGGGGEIFDINVPAGSQTIGFRGRSSGYLNAIGLNYATIDRPSRRRDRSRT
jgi:hypothetical protein